VPVPRHALERAGAGLGTAAVRRLVEIGEGRATTSSLPITALRCCGWRVPPRTLAPRWPRSPAGRGGLPGAGVKPAPWRTNGRRPRAGRPSTRRPSPRLPDVPGFVALAVDRGAMRWAAGWAVPDLLQDGKRTAPCHINEGRKLLMILYYKGIR